MTVFIDKNHYSFFVGFFASLTYQTPKLPSYRKQSFDLQNKSIEWFLHDGNLDV